MPSDQILVFVILAGTLALFVWGRIRFDLVALLSLLAVVLSGLVPAAQAFEGFGHPAVVTVAAVLVLSRGLRNAGVVELLAGRLEPMLASTTGHVFALAGTAALASAFMNNVGALALLMPVAIETARRHDRPPSQLLMPLSFGAILGGMATLIGTPPNIIVASFRTGDDGPFSMFDFTPVGLPVALVGVAFIALAGWRLIPWQNRRSGGGEALFRVADYLMELKVAKESPFAGGTLAHFLRKHGGDLTVTGIIRDGRRRPAPPGLAMIQADDVLIVRADAADLDSVLQEAGLEPVADAEIAADLLRSDDVQLLEAVVAPQSLLVGRTPRQAGFGPRHGVNLIAVARQGAQPPGRLAHVRFSAGDVILLQGTAADLADSVTELGCLPLASRDFRLAAHRRVPTALLIFGVALAVAAAGLLPSAVALTAAAVVYVLAGLIAPREMYDSVDWPVIVLLGAMFPLGGALQATGASGTLAGLIVDASDGLPVWAVLAALIVVTMTLSDVINNAATALVMAPIAIGIAGALEASADPFLMAVAVGASCAFLTPIGHQCNTIVMGPGGYRFADYWRLGLPLEIVIVALSVPLLLWVWPP